MYSNVYTKELLPDPCTTRMSSPTASLRLTQSEVQSVHRQILLLDTALLREGYTLEFFRTDGTELGLPCRLKVMITQENEAVNAATNYPVIVGRNLAIQISHKTKLYMLLTPVVAEVLGHYATVGSLTIACDDKVRIQFTNKMGPREANYTLLLRSEADTVRSGAMYKQIEELRTELKNKEGEHTDAYSELEDLNTELRQERDVVTKRLFRLQYMVWALIMVIIAAICKFSSS